MTFLVSHCREQVLGVLGHWSKSVSYILVGLRILDSVWGIKDLTYAT